MRLHRLALALACWRIRLRLRTTLQLQLQLMKARLPMLLRCRRHGRSQLRLFPARALQLQQPLRPKLH